LNALEHVYNLSIGPGSFSVLENELWKAVDIGVKNFKAKSLMIVVDGLDDKLGQQNATKISKRLVTFASNYKHVRAIILSRNFASQNTPKTKMLAITPDSTHNDLQHIMGQALRCSEYFSIKNDHEKEAIVEKLTHAAKGNFLNAQLITKTLSQQVSLEAFTKRIKATKDAPPHLEDSIKHLVSTATADFTKPETNLLISWLLVAERPLSVLEVRSLLQVDLQKKVLISRKADILDDIKNLCGPILRVQNGIVRFRHSAIREYLAKVQAEGKKLPTVQSAQGDLAVRLLAYCSMNLSGPYSPGFELPESAKIDALFLQDTLLEYAARNWIFHFKKSSWHKPAGTLELPHDFKVNFPSSVYLSMIEWTCWELQTPACEAIELHNLALRVRRAVFTDKHQIVLQSLIICGNLYKKLSNGSEAGSCFYDASRIGHAVLKANSVITLTCATSFLEVTKTMTSTTRVEIITRKEDMLQYVISACKHHYGKTSDIVIRHCTTLAEMYVAINEEHKAEAIYRELHEIMIVRHGKGSIEETAISGQMKVVLKADKHAEIEEYKKEIFNITTEKDIWDAHRVSMTLKLATVYETHGELLKVEELYVMLWSRLLEQCHQTHTHYMDIDVRISMIDVSLEYVHFLRRNHRHEEAAGVLICIWNEYEEYDFESEVIFLRLKNLGELMQAVSLFSIAISVFKKCRSWFKSHGKHEHVESCQTLIATMTREIIMSTTTQTTTVNKTIITVTETITKEVFNSTISSSVVTKESISICQSLVSFYLKREQGSEAIETSKKSLQLIWRMMVSDGGTIALPREFATEAIEIAFKLAICHHRLHHFHEAENVYIRIYRACFNSCQVHDQRLTKAYTALIDFYKEHGHWHKIIEIYQEVLVASRGHLGATHSLTIKTLYELGSLCSEHGHGHAYKYYEEITAALNGDSQVCHHDALRAMQMMCKIYYEEGKWEKLKANCEILWESWTKHHTVHKFEAKFVGLLYMRYIYVLENHCATSAEIIRIITLQYKDTCVVVFGSSATVTVEALIKLAQMYMRSEKHVYEAIDYYEEVSIEKFILYLGFAKFESR
jgi:tetratricopeptide (TPR) repeat protein